MKKIFLKSFCARCLTLLVLALLSTNLAWGEEVEITQIANIVDGGTYYIKGVRNISSVANTFYLTFTDATGSQSGTESSEKNKAIAITFTKVSNGVYNLKTPNGNYIAPGTSNGKINVSTTAINVTATDQNSKIRLSIVSGTNTWSIQKNINAVNFGGYKNTQSDITLVEATPSKTLTSIAVKTAPSKTTYNVGETFNPAGLVITGTYDDKSTEDIAYAGSESKFTFNPTLETALTKDDNKVTITYGEKTVDQAITVNLNKLSTPTNLQATPAPTSATLTWDAVANASKYEVNINNQTLTATTNSLLVGELTASTAYTWTVKAKGDNTTYEDSELSAESNFTTLAPPTVAYTVTFNGNNHGNPASGSLTENPAGSGVTLPDCTPNAGYQFVGWATSETATEADAGKAGATYYPTANITLFAVYNEVYTINYMVNGANTGAQVNVVKGTALVFPTVSAPDADHVFCGWVTTAIEGTQATAPEYVKTTGLTASENITYYAVFAEKEEGTPTKVSASATFNGSGTGGNSCTSGYTLTLTKTANKSGYIQDNASPNEQTIIKMQSTTAMFSSTPSKVTVKAKLGGGTANDDLTEASQVYAALVDNAGNIIYETQTVLTKKITATNGSDFSVNIPVTNIESAYGVAIYHTKLANYNVRYFSLEVNCEKSNITYSNYCTTFATKELTSISIKTAPEKIEYYVGDNFDPTGLEITLNYSDESTEDVTYAGNEESFTFNPALDAALQTTNTKVTITYGGKPVDQSITVIERPQFTVAYYALGNKLDEEVVNINETVADVPTETKLEGWTFEGWTENKDYAMSNTAPELFALETPITEDINLYAVYSKTEGVGGSYTLDYDAETTLKESKEWGAYGTSLEYTATDGSKWVVKAYKNQGMQINTGKNASIKIPDCPANISSIEITCSAQKAVGLSADDYAGSGDITYIATGTDAKSQTLDCSSESVTGGYIVPKSGSTAITKIVVNYGHSTTTYTITAPRTFTKTISDRKMATLYLDYAVTIPENVKAYTATDKGDHTAITLEKITDGVIPANTGVIIYSDIATDYTFTETTDAGSTYESNCLKGVTEKTAFDAVADYNTTAYNYYALMAGEGTSVVFKLVSAGSYAANSAYLVLPKTNAAKVDFTFDDEPTGIESLTPALSEGKGVYNLQGVRVNNGYKGIVIMNGKKYINK